MASIFQLMEQDFRSLPDKEDKEIQRIQIESDLDVDEDEAHLVYQLWRLLHESTHATVRDIKDILMDDASVSDYRLAFNYRAYQRIRTSLSEENRSSAYVSDGLKRIERLSEVQRSDEVDDFI